jgi:hypothetical protein
MSSRSGAERDQADPVHLVGLPGRGREWRSKHAPTKHGDESSSIHHWTREPSFSAFAGFALRRIRLSLLLIGPTDQRSMTG